VLANCSQNVGGLAELLEESRKTWDYAISDKVVNILKPVRVAFNSLKGIAKDYVEGSQWLESHLLFEVEGYAHYVCIFYFHQMPRLLGKIREKHVAHVTVNRNPPMLINVAEKAKTPKEWLLIAAASC
jgi:hypothetical protein